MEATVLILESAGATLLVLASVLILRAWWRTDEPGPRTPRVQVVKLTRVEAVHKRAA